jgi:hypothetical protein
MKPDIWTSRSETLQILKDHGFEPTDEGSKVSGVKTGHGVSFRICNGSEHSEARENQCVNVKEKLERLGYGMAN